MLSSISNNLANLAIRSLISRNAAFPAISRIHTTPVVAKEIGEKEKKKWDRYNEVVYPPQSPDEPVRPAFVCHKKENIHYSPKKMWYVATLIRGMTVDEALRQLKLVDKKGAVYARETILEAVELALKNHNVEYRSNLWIAESFCGKGVVFKGMRRHAKMRIGRVDYRHSNYFVRLEEGKPPKDYYGKETTPDKQLEQWLQKMRQRKITGSI